MLKHAHVEFPSDLFIVLETVGAKLNLSMQALDLLSYHRLLNQFQYFSGRRWSYSNSEPSRVLAYRYEGQNHLQHYSAASV